MSISEIIRKNMRKIMADRQLTQAVMAQMVETTPSQFSKILNGTVNLSLDQLSNLARGLSISEIDIITYPEVYKPQTQKDKDPVEAILQIRLQNDKKDQVMKLIFGKHDIEILNK